MRLTRIELCEIHLLDPINNSRSFENAKFGVVKCRLMISRITLIFEKNVRDTGSKSNFAHFFKINAFWWGIERHPINTSFCMVEVLNKLYMMCDSNHRCGSWYGPEKGRTWGEAPLLLLERSHFRNVCRWLCDFVCVTFRKEGGNDCSTVNFCCLSTYALGDRG